MAERIGKEKRTSVYKFPKKTNQGKTLWYKSLGAFGTGASKEYLESIDPFPEGSEAQKAFIKDLEKQFKYPLNSQAAKDAGVLSKSKLAKKHGITFKQASLQTEKYKKRLNLEYPSPPYEGKAYKKFKQKERRKFITKTSKPTTERDITKLYSKKGKFELGHRASLKQLVKLGVDYPLESLGFDTRTVNQELVKPFEKALESIYKKQNEIAAKYKGKVIPKADQLKINAFNEEISDLVEKSNRNLNGIIMDEKTGKFSHIYGQEALKAPGAGFIDTTVKKTTEGDLDVIGINVKEQKKFAKAEETKLVEKLKALYNSEPKGSPVRKAMDNRVPCADGCFVKVANKNPQRIVQRFTEGVKNFFVPKPEMPSIKYDDTLGAFVNSGTDDVVSQGELKTWAADNPMPVKAGTAKPGMLRKTGRALAHLGLPLPTAALDTYFIGKQIQEGRDSAEIAKDPLNWLGLATMEPLTKAAGVADKSGKMASVMRLGMSPGMIRGATRFLGLPGLIISGGLTAYDQYKKYQDKEGFVYDLFNKEEIDNTPV